MQDIVYNVYQILIKDFEGNKTQFLVQREPSVGVRR